MAVWYAAAAQCRTTIVRSIDRRRTGRLRIVRRRLRRHQGIASDRVLVGCVVPRARHGRAAQWRESVS